MVLSRSEMLKCTCICMLTLRLGVSLSFQFQVGMNDTEKEYLSASSLFGNEKLQSPWGLAYDRTNNVVYVADYGSSSIRKITEDYKITKLPLEGNLGAPSCITVTKDGHTLFVTESTAHCVKRIDLRSNTVQLIAGTHKQGKMDGAFSIALFAQPKGIVLDSSERNLFLCDASNNCIRKLDLENQWVSTVTGLKKGDADGPFETAEFNWPHGLAFDSKSNLYVADAIGDKIRYVDFSTRRVSTVFGSNRMWKDGHAKHAQAYIPTAVMFDRFLDCLWFCDTSHKIRRYDVRSKMVSTIAGNVVKGEERNWITTQFSKPIGICMDSQRNLFVSDHGNNMLWKITYNRGRFWKYIRLLWIGHLKNSHSCWFAKLPRDMIQEIARHFIYMHLQY